MAIAKPTLIVHTTYFPVDEEDPSADPERAAARVLGEELYDLLTRPTKDRLAWGAGVPIRIATRHDLVDVDEAAIVVVVPVLGEYAQTLEDVRRAAMERIAKWSTRCCVLPVFRWQGWRAHEAALGTKALLTDLEPAGRGRTIDEIVLTLSRLLAGDNHQATRLFISHSKGDLDATERAAEAIRDYVQSNTTAEKPFFDRVSLLAGEDLAEQVDANAGDGVFVAVRGDSYSSRAWCVRELLKAKQRRLPILTVEVLSKGERRSSAYSGNAPTIVWERGPRDEQSEPAAARKKAAAARVVTLAMAECVRSLLFAREARRVAEAAVLDSRVVEMPRPPELLDLPALRSRNEEVVVVLHPDPELPFHERALLEEADKRIRTITPTTAFSGPFGRASRAPLDGWQVALSLSDTPSVQGLDGVHADHVHDATVFLARALLSAGAAIAYGGDFRRLGYTELLAQLVLAYNQTARKPADQLHSYLAAQMKRPDSFTYAHTAHHLGRYGSSRHEARLPMPGLDDSLPHHPSLYFSDMRRVMEKHTTARVVLSGNVKPESAHDEGYKGRYPGVVEEAWRALQAGHPLYVVGGFGGAARLVADILENDELPRELDEATWNNKPAWNQLVATLDSDPAVAMLELPRTQMELAAAVRACGKPFLADDAAALKWNGLTLDENRTLFRTRDTLTIASLVLKGLITAATRKARGKLKIELVEGDLSSASDLDVMVFPTFANVTPTGAAAALDAISGNAASRAHQERRPVPAASRAVGASFLYAAELGPVNDAMSDPATHVREAAAETAEIARRHRFARVGIVTFLGNVADRLADVVGAMVDGLRGCPEETQLVWFERDPGRAALLASILRGERDVEVSHVVAPIAPPVEARPGKQRTFVAVRQAADEIDVAVLVPHANGLAPNFRLSLSKAERDKLAGTTYDATPRGDDLAARGAQIAKLLFGEDAGRVLSAIGDSEVVIVHDAASSALPFETLAWGSGAKRVTPATRRGIVRHLLANVSVERGLPSPPHAGKVGVLVIINPRGDLPGAQAEGVALVNALGGHPDVEAPPVVGDQAVKALGGHPDIDVRPLVGNQATVARVLKELADPTIDIVHYCGHAFYRGSGPHQSGLNLANGEELTIEHLRELTRVPRLAVFNACQAGRVRGMPEFRAPQTFAEFFLHAGVEAYLGTFWLVSDAGAADFAAELYKQLGAGRELGDAVVAARHELQNNDFEDWANYVLYGRVGFRLVRGGGMGSSDSPSVPPPSGDAAANRLVATWSFPTASAPDQFAVTVTERFSDLEQPVATSGPIRVERRNGWNDGSAIVQWVAMVDLPAPVAQRAFRLRATDGDPIDIGTPTRAAGTRGPSDAFAELERLRTILDQQPDRGRAILSRIMPSADPDELRGAIDTEIERVRAQPPDRAIWPFDRFAPAKVDSAALASFIDTYKLADIDEAMVADQHFQTKEDWARYASASGGAKFHLGWEVERPLSEELGDPAVEMTHDVRDGEIDDNSIEIALFGDYANGVHVSRAIAKQIVDANVPYAFHLGDVYYGGTEGEFADFFEAPLAPMFDRTELFMITGNHEMYARGEWFKKLIRRKRHDHPARQRQVAESFRLRGPSFQIIGLDTMFVGWKSGRVRLHDYADADRLRLLDTWLSERPGDLTILLTTNEAWDKGSQDTTRLYRSLRDIIAGRVDLWLWGNVHYAALYDMWPFTDARSPLRRMVTSCIGHGGYPFYTQKSVGLLPSGLTCRWHETRSRFWPETQVRPDVGLNGWCRMKLARGDDGWDIELLYRDWIGRDRCRARLGRKDAGGIFFKSVEETDIANVGDAPTWRKLELGSVK
jgi:hypothetical protein